MDVYGGLDPYIGTVIAGRYRVLRLLGTGQMANVYVADQITLARNVAIKMMLDELELDDVAVQRFRREVNIVATLRSPHTIQCYDAGEAENGSLFLAMELLAGETLRDWMQRDGTIPAADVIAIAAQVGASLQEAHDAGIVHRDLKPENVFSCAHATPLRPFVKVLDFGLAKLITPESKSMRLTDRCHVVGTPAYMAPELVVRGRSIDHRSDIYALGVMCFEMLTGQLPFGGDTPTMMALAQATAPIPRASEADPRLPVAIDHAFDRLLAKDPAMRPQNATEVADVLADVLL